MTHKGYTLRYPTLKTNYIKLLSMVDRINWIGPCPTRKELKKISGIGHNDGADKAIAALLDGGYLEDDALTGGLCVTEKGEELLSKAAESAVRNHIDFEV